MRKMLVVARREYLAAVRTKTFIISLLIMPVMMLGSIAVQWLLRDLVDTADKKFVLVDRAGRPELAARIQSDIDVYNQTKVFAKSGKEQKKPRFVLEPFSSAARSRSDIDQERFELSEKIRAGKLLGFVEILPPGARSLAKENNAKSDAKSAARSAAVVVLRYQSNNPTYTEFARFVENSVTEKIRGDLAQKAGLTDDQAKALITPVAMETKGLSKRDDEGKVVDATDMGRFGPVVVPMGLMMLMFMVVLMTATPLMQGVVEEKMQRIAEVLLGSVPPFPLMMGKLIGMTGVSLTIALVYLGGAYWAAHQFGFTDFLTTDLLLWFVIFQALAGLMFGSLFIAVGAACTDLKETQNLLWPIMLLATLPLFLMGNVLREPNSPVVRGISLFPFATPTLMMARLGVPPGPAWWEPVLGVAVVLATTIFCVYAAGRIFRVGILLQGKGAKIREMVKWVFRA